MKALYEGKRREMRKSWKEMYEDAIRARRDDKAGIAALEARCRDYRDALEEIASYRGPDSGIDITARHMRDAAREAIGYETETACEHEWRTTFGSTPLGSVAFCTKCIIQHPDDMEPSNES